MLKEEFVARTRSVYFVVVVGWLPGFSLSHWTKLLRVCIMTNVKPSASCREN